MQAASRESYRSRTSASTRTPVARSRRRWLPPPTTSLRRRAAAAGAAAAPGALRPARSGADRAGLLGGVLSGKISAEALDLITALVSGRWSAPSELLNGAERLGIEALLASADSAGELGEVEDELFRFGQVVAVRGAGKALADPTVPAAQRATLVDHCSPVRPDRSPATSSGSRSPGSADVGSPGAHRLVEMAADRGTGRSRT